MESSENQPTETPETNQPDPIPKGSQVKQHNNFQIVAILMVVAVAVFLGYVWLQSSKDGKPAPQTPNTADSSATTQQSAIVITKDGFSPATVRVQKGTTVTWTNQDDSPHQVTSDPHPTHEALPGLDSEEALAKGDSFSFTFEQPGTFTYHDHLNPLKLLGTVIVE